MALFDYEYQPKNPATEYPSLFSALQGEPVQAEQRPGGIMSFLSNPAMRAMLAGISQRALEAGAPSLTPKGRGFTAALGASVMGANEGLQSFEEMQAKRIADQFNKRIKEAELRKMEAEAAKLEGGSDPFSAAFGDSAENIRLANYARQLWREGGGDPQQYIDAVNQWQLSQAGQQVVSVAPGGRVDLVERNPLPTLPGAGSAINAPGPRSMTIGQRDNPEPARDDQNWVRQTTWDLRKEYDANNLKLADYSNKLSQAEQLLNSNQSGTTDVAIVNTFQKLIDEGAVVREGDVTLLSSTGGAFGTLKQMFGDLRAGEKLPPEVRAQMLETIRVLKNQFDQRRAGLANDYRSRAQDFGLDPDKIAKPAAPVQPFTPSRLDRVRDQRSR